MSEAAGKMHRQVIEAAVGGALILTVNKRLARFLRELFDKRMMDEGRRAWESPRIVSLDAWLRAAASQLGDDWRLLGSFSAQRLWEEVIEKHTEGTGLGLLQVAATARQTMEAHRLLAEYEARIGKTRCAMQVRGGIELLIVTDPSNMAWLTGYDG